MTDIAPQIDLRARAEAHLRDLAGPEATLRADQWTAIEALVVKRKRALVVQRTGWGKSAVYFVATALLRAAGAGPTVIISPLLALMRNQIDAAAKAGVHAATINSSNMDDWDRVRDDVAAGSVDLLLVSPERLNNLEFREAILPGLAKDAGLIVVDEAHCVSDWGHDFRPDYRRIRDLLDGLPEGIPVLATTATANARVSHDVAEQLGEDTLVLRGTLERESLSLSVVRTPDAPTRLAWLAERLRRLPGSGIVYSLTVAGAEQTAEYLREQGHEVRAYTGKTDADERLLAERDLLDNKVKALVATSALGMGFDKPDLGFVVHLGAPSSPVAYYQQVGRAGRGVDRAEVILLPGKEDTDIWAYFASMAFPPERIVTAALSLLAEPMSVPQLETHLDLSRSRLDMMLKVLDVDGAVRRLPRSKWEATGQPWTYDSERYTRIAGERRAEQDAMLAYLDTSECRMAYLRGQLDDPQAAPCGRCDNCTGERVDAEVSETAAESARGRLYRPGAEIAPRRMWPSGLGELGLSGKIKPELQAEEGRALAPNLYVGWGQRVRSLLDPQTPDGELPDDVLAALLDLIKGWGIGRPGAVVSMASSGRPVLLGSAGRRIAEVGRIPYLGALEYRAGSPGSQFNSARRVSAVWGTLTVPDEVAAGLPEVTGKVLLVDDVVDTRWTVTVAGRLLREAGAEGVVPLVMALTG
ncbi:DEAD/DEAH box helicase [Phytomonospora sp. NPDC050363]|uniref:RecQ family ATP-dependent DNA helicase n=1 Tax=Phytomonospora sp. NPDC050363 TaxID=3155642 RepID=UPI0033D09484